MSQDDVRSECSETMEVSSVESEGSRSATPEMVFTIEEVLQLREENEKLKETVRQLREEVAAIREEAAERHRQMEGYFHRLLDQKAEKQNEPSSLEKLSQAARKIETSQGPSKPEEENRSAKTTKKPTEKRNHEDNTTERGNKRKLQSPGPSVEAETTPEQPQKQARTATPPNTEANPKIPPVVIRDKESWTRVSALLRREKINFAKAKLIKDGVAVTPATADDHRRMTRVLLREKQEYHTYSLQEEKMLRVVIRGIPNGVEPEDIIEDLKTQGLAPIAVHRMTSRSTKQLMPLVLVQLPKGQEDVLKVNRCCGLVVKTELQKQQPGASQCHRCQKFGHGQGRCTAQPRCVKCGEAHETRTCEKLREAPAKCANCGGPHPASYRGCKAFPKLATRKTQAPKDTATTNKTQVTPPKVAPGASYAEAAKPKRAQAGAAKGAQTPGENVDLATLAAQFAKMQEALSLLTNFIKNMPSLSPQVNG